MRVLVVLLVAAALGFGAWLVLGKPFTSDPVTKAEIEREVAKKPRGRVQLVLCNEQFVPPEASRQASSAHTWTCDTYLGRSTSDAQNGPSYRVIVDDDRIQSIKRVPTH